MNNFHSFEINFTPFDLYPPYANTIHLKFINANNLLKVEFNIKYIGREELTEEEILDEGFTLDDDYNWNGSLSSVWIDPIQNLINKSTFVKEESEIKVLIEAPKIISGSPENIDEWAYLIQEVTQAIYETSGKEGKLEINFIKNFPQDFITINLKPEFKSRKFIAEIEKNDQKKTVQLKWEDLKNTLQTVYLPEYIYENSLPAPGNAQGYYINTGEGIWFKANEGVVKLSEKDKSVTKLIEMFEKISKK